MHRVERTCRCAGQAPVYALEGSIAVTGSLVQWVRDNLGLIRSAAEIETLARTVEDNGGCYFVPAFAGLFAPHWRSDARGVIVGLTGYVNRGHIARAVLEAVAWQSAASSHIDEAVKTLRQAADAEDAVEKLPLTPGPIVPAREQLGDLLLNLNQPQEALKEYQAALVAAPGRRGALTGAVQAADLSGDSQLAGRLREKLLKD